MEMRYSRDRLYSAEKLKLTNHCLGDIFQTYFRSKVCWIIAKAIKVDRKQRFGASHSQ